jgi:hypothetical protein
MARILLYLSCPLLRCMLGDSAEMPAYIGEFTIYAESIVKGESLPRDTFVGRR